jgi:hypothetical protein
MNKSVFILTISLFLITISCNKIDSPSDDSEANDPIYLLEGIMDDDSLKLYVNDTTIFISNGTYNMNGVEAYSSTISDVENNFEFKIIVIRPEIYLDEDGVKLIKQGDLKYIVHETVCKEFTFSNGSTQPNFLNIEINGSQFQGATIDVEEYGKYDAIFEFSNAVVESHQIPIEIGFKDEILNPYIEIQGAGNGIYFSGLNHDLEHKWELDDQLISSEIQGEITLNNGIHVIKHSVIDTYNNEASYTTLVKVDSDQFVWVMDYDYCTNIVENNYGNVLIEVIKDGEKYTSVYNSTNFENKLEVTNIVYVVDVNSQSIDFVKFNIKFDAELKNKDNSKSLNLKNMTGVFNIEIN